MENLKELLAAGIVHFTYTKSNGDTREAFGSVHSDYIPKYSDKDVENLCNKTNTFLKDWEDDKPVVTQTYELLQSLAPFSPKPKKESKPKPAHLVTYYDLGAKGWRSFNSEKLTNILSVDKI